ncbi:MAG: Hsp20/alpha crystallin family protein [Ferruginibacter sp.]
MNTVMRRNSNAFNTLPALFDDFFGKDPFNWRLSSFSDTGTTVPAVNIKETKDNFEVQMAAPGMTKDDFKVELEGSMLTISSEKSSEQESNEENRYSRREYCYQSFQRSFTLSKEVVDEEKIQAKYEGGVLHLVIPKKEEAKQKPPRLIKIS